MRVLVVATPGTGHTQPLLPLITALIAAGDHVAVAAAAQAEPMVVSGGAEFHAAGHGEAAWFETLAARTRGIPGDGLPPDRIYPYFVPRLFGEIATSDMIDDVLAVGRQIQPELVIFETYAMAGPLVADILGVPQVHHLISPMLPHDVMRLANDAVSPLWRSFDRPAPSYAGAYAGLTIEISPAALEPRTVPAGESLVMRPAVASTRDKRDRPTVYVTFGTFFNANLEVFRIAMDGLANAPYDVVMTVGADQNPADLGPPPTNVRVATFIPQQELLPDCSVVVHHGGSGTMLASLAHGVPQVVIPQGADNFINGQLLMQAGAGLLLLGDATARDVRGAVDRVLEEPNFATAAGQAAREIAEMAAPEEIAAALHDRYDT